MKRRFDRNGPAEEAAVQAGIAADLDNPEWTDENSQPLGRAADVVPPQLLPHRRRGPGRKPAKVLVTMRLDPEVLEGLRASGPGWRGRVNGLLRAALNLDLAGPMSDRAAE